MKMYTLAIILETRTPRKDGKFPVKLRLTIDRKTRYYGLGEYVTQKEFQKYFDSEKMRKNNLSALESYLISELERADNLLKSMKPPTFKKFKNLFTMKGTGGNIEMYYNAMVAECKKEGRYGTADNYQFALNSLDTYKNISKLNFIDITPTWLKSYVNIMREKGKSTNTLSMYLRTLRTIYRRAMNDGIVNPIHYPFGDAKKGLFSIPSSEKNKRPLEKSEMRKLAKYKGDPENEKFLAFFLLSYYLVGLNPQDMLSLKWSDLDGDILTVVRKKTVNTTSTENKIELFVNRKALAIIKKYGNKGGVYIFNVFDEKDNPLEVRRKIKNFNRGLNTALKIIADKVGVKKNISAIYARHSAASHAMENGANLADISQALGHTDLKTTSNYISSLSSGRRLISKSLEL